MGSQAELGNQHKTRSLRSFPSSAGEFGTRSSASQPRSRSRRTATLNYFGFLQPCVTSVIYFTPLPFFFVRLRALVFLGLLAFLPVTALVGLQQATCCGLKTC